MQRRNIIALSIFLLFYLSFGAFLTISQERIIYQPSNRDFFDCPALRTAEPVVHRGTRFYTRDLTKPVAVLYHGNAGSACDRAFYANLFSQAGYGYVLVEYAGYSNDPLPPSHERIKNDVHNVIAFLAEQSITDITLVGESIGTGVASYHVSLASPERLILISPFTTLAAVARNRFWFYPTNWLVDNAYDNVVNLANYRGRTLILHGAQDTLIPSRLGRELAATLPASSTTMVEIDTAGHNDLFLQPQTMATIINYLD